MGTELPICRACLSTDVALFNIYENDLANVFEQFSGVSVDISDGFPPYLCAVCMRLIKRYSGYRLKTQLANDLLQKIIPINENSDMKLKHLEKINLLNLQTTNIEMISYIPDNRHVDIIEEEKISSIGEESRSFFEVEASNEELINKEYDEIDFKSENSIETITSSCSDDDEPHSSLVCDEVFVINSIKNKNVTVKGEELSSEETECDKTGVKSENGRKRMTTCTESENGVSEIGSISAIDDKNVLEICIEKVGEELFIDKNVKKEKDSGEAKVKSEINWEAATSTHTHVTRSIEIRNMVVIDGEKITERKVKTKKKRIRAPKRSKDDPLNEKLPDDFEIDDKYKTATLRYNYRPTHVITRGHMEKQLDDLEKFSKIYRVDIKYMSKEEQLAVLQERKEHYKDCSHRCNLCLVGFRTLETYTSHMKLHDPVKGDFACDICGIRFRRPDAVKKHVNLTHLKRFTCQLCGKVTKSQCFAKAHHALHNDSTTLNKTGARYKYDPKPIKCPICMDDFRGKIGVRNHTKYSHRQMVTCSDCGAHFENKNLLVKHLGDRCSPDDSPCPMCGLNFSTEAQMMKHFEDTHRGIYKCGHCDMSFTSKFQYSAHQSEIRKKERSSRKSDYMCEVCGKENFKSASSLLSHQLVHTESRSYKCSLCPKAFRHLNAVKFHMRAHANERGYKCPTCSKGFNQQAHRDAHMLTHTKERPYKCHICPKAYTGAGSLKEHIDSAHKGMPPRKRGKH